MKGILFKREMRLAEEAGIKTETRRTGKQKYFPGEPVYIKDRMFLKAVDAKRYIRIKEAFQQKLGDMTEKDALNEGIKQVGGATFKRGKKFFHIVIFGWPDMSLKDTIEHAARTPLGAYKNLWKKINGPGSWMKNEMVWVYRFEPISRWTAFGVPEEIQKTMGRFNRAQEVPGVKGEVYRQMKMFDERKAISGNQKKK